MEFNNEETYNPTAAMEAKIDFKNAIAHLSKHEQNICMALAEGKSVSAVAASMHLSRRKVKDIVVKALGNVAREYGIGKKTSRWTSQRKEVRHG